MMVTFWSTCHRKWHHTVKSQTGQVWKLTLPLPCMWLWAQSPTTWILGSSLLTRSLLLSLSFRLFSAQQPKRSSSNASQIAPVSWHDLPCPSGSKPKFLCTQCPVCSDGPWCFPSNLNLCFPCSFCSSHTGLKHTPGTLPAGHSQLLLCLSGLLLPWMSAWVVPSCPAGLCTSVAFSVKQFSPRLFRRTAFSRHTLYFIPCQFLPLYLLSPDIKYHLSWTSAM